MASSAEISTWPCSQATREKFFAEIKFFAEMQKPAEVPARPATQSVRTVVISGCERRLSVVGDALSVRFPLGAVHLFDAESGRALAHGLGQR